MYTSNSFIVLILKHCYEHYIMSWISLLLTCDCKWKSLVKGPCNLSHPLIGLGSWSPECLDCGEVHALMPHKQSNIYPYIWVVKLPPSFWQVFQPPIPSSMVVCECFTLVRACVCEFDSLWHDYLALKSQSAGWLASWLNTRLHVRYAWFG